LNPLIVSGQFCTFQEWENIFPELQASSQCELM